MQFKFLAPLALATAAFAQYSNTTVTYVTTVDKVVTAFTTYCPSPTSIVTNGKTYTVTGATTLTITDCPCTIKSVSTVSTVHSTSSGSAHAPTISTASGAAAKAGAAGLAAVAGVAAYLL